MDKKEADDLIREMARERDEEGLKGERENIFIENCFLLLDKHPSIDGQCRAALMLSRMIKRGLGERTLQFLEDHPALPLRAQQVLVASTMRMDGF